MIATRLWLPLALAVLGTFPVEAVTPHLVKDLNPAGAEAGSSPVRYVNALGLTFFNATDPDTGTEVWRTDGTPEGTEQVLDACPGVCSSDLNVVAVTDRFVLLYGPDGDGSALWATDGHPAHTFHLVDLSGFGGSWGRGEVWIRSQGLLYFIGRDGRGAQIWRTDGTPAGTYRVSDFETQNDDQLGEPTEFQGRLYFRAADASGVNLWMSDGTPRGTRRVTDFLPGGRSLAGPTLLRVLGRTLIFAAPTPRQGQQLWRSDGTPRGTYPLTRLKPRPGAPASVLSAIVVGRRLYFAADTQGPGQELWVTDGTPKGTRALTAFPKAAAFLQPPAPGNLPIRSFQGRLLFTVDDGPHGVEIWTSDGTPNGTRLLRDLCPGACSGAQTTLSLAPAGDRVYFPGSDGARGFEPWVTDGTPTGTRLLRDICAGSCGSDPFFLPAAGQAFFVTRASATDRQLWRTDGTPRGTRVLTRFADADFLARGFQGAVRGQDLLFTGDGPEGLELWKSHGTVAGTGLLANLSTSTLGGSFPSFFFEAGGLAHFYATDGTQRGVFESDGSAAGTRLVAPIPSEGSSRPSFQSVAVLGSDLFLYGYLPGSDRNHLYRLDPSGPVQLAPNGVMEGPAVSLGGRLYFAGDEGAHGLELWSSDGTPEGTGLAVELEPGPVSSGPQGLTVFAGRLYFFAGTSQDGPSLFRSDGTEAGTVPLAPLATLAESPRLVEHAGRLWFLNRTAPASQSLVSTDGTPGGTQTYDLGGGIFDGKTLFWAGTRLFLSGGSFERGFGLFVWNGTGAPAQRVGDVLLQELPVLHPDGSIYFPGRPSMGSTTSLWKSDGTPQGTVQIFGPDGQILKDPWSLQSFAGKIYFLVRPDLLYSTDGTAAGTLKVLDGVQSPDVGRSNLLVVGPHLFFSRYDPATGTEPWVLEEN